ncbi:MAG: RHS repeat-associated core domain-containing protein, partial [Clostridia bacterium]|nr:RHS repeat-associated core domain-containing protein [Clostridia bacterium]
VEIENPQKTNSRKFDDLKVLTNLTSRATYKGIYDGIDLEYILVGNNIKENIIVNKAQKSYTYSFEIKLNKLVAELRDGAVILSDYDSGEQVYKIPAPYMLDANGAYSQAVEYTLTQQSKWKYTLTVTADPAWINAEDRAFPVTADPTMNFVNSTTNYGSQVVGESLGVSTEKMAYVKANTLPALPNDAYVTAATLSLKHLSGQAGYVGAYLKTSAHLYETASSPVDYNYIVANEDGTYGADGWYSWNIVDLARAWYNGTANNGVALKLIEGEENIIFSTESHPLITISYRDMKGVESYWSYLTQNAGMAGSGAVNLATGALTFQIGTLTTTDSIFSFTPTLVYNSGLALEEYKNPNAQTGYWYSYAANGFKLNINETIIKKAYTNAQGESDYYYIWADADGTEHSFVNNNDGVYYDEDGLQLSLIIDSESNICKIIDTGHNEREFIIIAGAPSSVGESVWFLNKLRDKSGNELRFYFDGSKKPNDIKFTPSGTTQTTVMISPLYNSGGKLTLLWCENQKEGILLRHSETPTGSISPNKGSYLREALYIKCDSSITWATVINSFLPNADTPMEGVEVLAKMSYEYDENGLLRYAYDTKTGYEIAYRYTNGKVTEIIEYGYNEDGAVEGQTMGISYYSGYTEVRASGTDDIYGNDDDIIGVYTFDDSGRVVSTYTTNVERTQIYGASSGAYVSDNEKAKNSIKEATEYGITSPNYILNGSFEMLPSATVYWNTAGSTFVARRTMYEQLDNYRLGFNLAASTSSSISQAIHLPQDGIFTLALDILTTKIGDYELMLEISNSSRSFAKEMPINSAEGISIEYSDTIEFYIPHGGVYNVKISVSSDELMEAGTCVFVDNIMLSKGTGKVPYNSVSYGNFGYGVTLQSGTEALPVLNNGSFWYNERFDENGDVEKIDVLLDSNNGITISDTMDGYFANALKIYGQVDKTAVAQQQIYFETPLTAEDRWHTSVVTVSGYAKAVDNMNSQQSAFRLLAYYKYKGEEAVHYVEIPFNKAVEGWQYASGTVTIRDDKLIEYFIIGCEYSNNVGYAYFDNICVTQDRYETSLSNEYNEDGKLIYEERGSTKTFYEYNSNGDLTHIVTDKGKMIEYVYGNSEKPCHITEERVYEFIADVDSKNLETILEGALVNKLSNVVYYTYNSYGLVTRTETVALGNKTEVDDQCERLIEETEYYVDKTSKIFGAVKSQTNGFGDTTRYFYDTKYGYLLAEIYPDNTGLKYTYDSLGGLLSVQPALFVQSSNSYTVVDDGAEVSYTYDDSLRLSTINTGGTIYTLGYDAFGNNNSIKIGNTEIVSQEINDANGKLKSVTYIDGTTVSFTYDHVERLIKTEYTKNDSVYASYVYEYYSNGNLYKVIDEQSKLAISYEYDLAGNITSVFSYNTETMEKTDSYGYTYDDKERLYSSAYYTDYALIHNSDLTTSAYVSYIRYYNDDDSLQKYSVNFVDHFGNYVLEYTYDSFDRLSTKKTTLKNCTPSEEINQLSSGIENVVQYVYKNEGNVTSALIEQYVRKIRVVVEGNCTTEQTQTLNYEYDSMGNITSVSLGDFLLVSYVYDSLGQLVRENNRELDKTLTYSYDNNGNLLCVNTYAYTVEALGEVLSTDTYTYSTGDWKDQLVSFNGQEIEYDALGNPTTYLGATLTWESLRELASYVDSEYTISYEYDINGIRSSKTVNGVKHTYTTEGTMILFEEYGSILLAYFYDEAGLPVGFAYRNSQEADTSLEPWEQFTYYLFEKNLQGDITAIYDSNGEKVASYVYDAWGNHTVTNYTSDNVGNMNPFRYRGYYYDSETGLYYLNSRYYDPQTRRFINADDISYLGANGDLQSYNLYAYCSNNPVMFVDNQGNASNVNPFLTGFQIRASAGWQSSPKLIQAGNLFRVGFSQYVTKTQGSTGSKYIFAGVRGDNASVLGETLYFGAGLKSDSLGVEIEWYPTGGGSAKILIGRLSFGFDADLAGLSSFTIGVDTQISEDEVLTEGFTIGFNSVVAVGVVFGLIYYGMTGDASVVQTALSW